MAPRCQVYGRFSEGFKIHCEIDSSSGKSLSLLGLSVSVFHLSYLIHNGSVPPVLLKTNKA